MSVGIIILGALIVLLLVLVGVLIFHKSPQKPAPGLAQCPICKNAVSSLARTCPACGTPFPQKKANTALAHIVITVVLLLLFFGSSEIFSAGAMVIVVNLLIYIAVNVSKE